MLDDLTSAQLSEWEAYDRIDPIGQWRNDLNFAKLLAFFENVVGDLYGSKDEVRKRTTPLDHMPVFDVEEVKKKKEDEEKKRQDDLTNTLLSWAKQTNKKAKKRDIRITPPVKKERK